MLGVCGAGNGDVGNTCVVGVKPVPPKCRSVTDVGLPISGSVSGGFRWVLLASVRWVEENVGSEEEVTEDD